MSEDESYKYFSYCPRDGFEFHKTSEEAKERANELIEGHLVDNLGIYNDWEVEQVCWGEIKGIATKSDVRPDETGRFDYVCNYTLKHLNL